VHGRWLKLLEPALAYTDFIFPNREEDRQLTGESDPAAIAARLRRLEVKTVIVKLGAAGCYVESAEGAFASPGITVHPVDTTGAGDCFAARQANACGALATLGLGGSHSAPTRAKVEELLHGCPK
jgi:sugar/nucleoside kinase (ribokinase family)